MFVYILWAGDCHENRRHFLGHRTKVSEDEFMELCWKIKRELIKSTSQNHEIMETVDGVKSIWEYVLDDDLLKAMKKVLIEKYDFFELKPHLDFPCFHVKGVDPYDYD